MSKKSNSVAVILLTLCWWLAFSTAQAQPPDPVTAGVNYLRSSQNPSGSWGPQGTGFRDSAAVVNVLALFADAVAEYGRGLAFLANNEPGNFDYLARRNGALVAAGFDPTALVARFIDGQNPSQLDARLPNFPEGGWGIERFFASDALDTALALSFLSTAGFPAGLVAADQTVTPDASSILQIDLPPGSTMLRVVIPEISGAVDFRFGIGGPPPLSAQPLRVTTPIVITLPDVSGTLFIRADSAASSTYSLLFNFTADGLDRAIVNSALFYLVKAQSSDDGGWGLTRQSVSNLTITLHVLLTLAPYGSALPNWVGIGPAFAYLLSFQNADGGFGSDLARSTIYDTALAILAMLQYDPSLDAITTATNFLTSRQQPNGSWNNNPYETALAVSALAMQQLK